MDYCRESGRRDGAQRGFLLTSNEAYLEPFDYALRAIPSKLQDIDRLTAENSGQSERLATLKQHVDAKLAEVGETIDVRRKEGLEAALVAVNSDRGKSAMDAIPGTDLRHGAA